jgi:hypothetical protein
MTGLFDGGNKSLSFGERGDNTWLGKWQGGIVVHISGELASMKFNDPSEQKTFKNGEKVTKRVLSLDTRSGKTPAAALDEEDDLTRDWHVDKGSGPARSIRTAEKKFGNIAIGSGVYTRWVSGAGNIGDPRVFETVIEPGAPQPMFNEPEPAAPGVPSFPAQVPAQQAPPSFPAQVPAPAQQPPPAGFDPVTGQPLAPTPPPAANPAPYGFSPQTGQPNPAPAQQPPPAGFDPVTGQPLAPTPPPAANPYAQ